MKNKNKREFFLIIFLFTISNLSFSQSRVDSLFLLVTDNKSNLAIPSIVISYTDSLKNFPTEKYINIDGNYRIKLSNKSTIKISSVGYTSIVLNPPKEKTTNYIHIELQQSLRTKKIKMEWKYISFSDGTGGILCLNTGINSYDKRKEKDGLWREYNRSAIMYLANEGYYKHGIKVGIWRYWNEKKKLVKEETWDKGKLLETHEY